MSPSSQAARLLCLLIMSASFVRAADSKELAATVERFARVGSASAPDFSPDGKWISYIANLSGVPQVWIIPAEGGYPRMVTNSSDLVTQANWSPTSDWIVVTIAPGGGLNTQIYLVKPDGTGLRRLTDGGKDNNGFDAWHVARGGIAAARVHINQRSIVGRLQSM
jgi:dipeptidyl aminopeptidase/acylaminoacyl peptidase